MPTNLPVKSSPNSSLVENPEKTGPALAQVISVEADRDVILGQAWLVAPNRLATCGHVVEQFVQDPIGLFLYFPNSGKRYPVQQVRLHPNFFREPDGLVKFDAALISVQLSPPDSLAAPLPFTFDMPLRVNQPFVGIRYPVHLGQYGETMQPLSQEGQFLGLMHKRDNYHLYHDVPLSGGDSGAPITDGKLVVGLHCGDTATLPGLNLATTSIRFGLWIDALKELGVQETKKPQASASNLVTAVIAFIACMAVTFGACMFFKPGVDSSKRVMLGQPTLAPVKVEFNKPLDKYSEGEPIQLTVSSQKPCYVFLFASLRKDYTLCLYPHVTPQSALKFRAGDEFKIEPLSGYQLIGDYEFLEGGKPAGSEIAGGKWVNVPLQMSGGFTTYNLVILDATDAETSTWARTSFILPGERVPSTPFIHAEPKTLWERAAKWRDTHKGMVLLHKFELLPARKGDT